MSAANPPPDPFAEAPEKVWELHRNALRMAASLLGLILWILQQVSERGAAENDGNPKVFRVDVKQGPNRFGRVPYQRRILPKSGFFKVIMRVADEPDVTLLFSFRDLYLIGFLYGNIWRVFSDAKLDNLAQNQRRSYCKSLGFEGRYNAMRWSSVLLGIHELFLTHGTLSNYEQRVKNGQREEVQNALFRLMVIISEAVRFHRWLSHLLAMIRGSRSETVDDASASIEFPDLFQNWSTISKNIRDGPDAFELADGGSGFDTYLEMLYSVAVLLHRPTDDERPVVDYAAFSSRAEEVGLIG